MYRSIPNMILICDIMALMCHRALHSNSLLECCKVPQDTHNTSRALLQRPGALAGSDEYFVTVAPDGNFALNCQKVFIAGWNQ